MSRDRSIIAALAGAILVTGCAAPAASSQPQDQLLAVDQVAGFWSLRAADGGARCDLSLSNLLIDGVRPVRAERCGVPGVDAARSWRATAGGFELVDARGGVVMAFRRTGEDAFEAAAGALRLTRAPLS